MTEQDDALLKRIQPLMKRRKGYSEKKMFGGVCFLIHGNMCGGIWRGSLFVRLNKEDHEEIQLEPYVKPMDITGRVMKGWALLEPKGIASDADLKAWLDRGVKFARSLPAK